MVGAVAPVVPAEDSVTSSLRLDPSIVEVMLFPEPSRKFDSVGIRPLEREGSLPLTDDKVVSVEKPLILRLALDSTGILPPTKAGKRSERILLILTAVIAWSS